MRLLVILNFEANNIIHIQTTLFWYQFGIHH